MTARAVKKRWQRWDRSRVLESSGALVRACRKKVGLSQAELARLAGVGKTVIFDFEKGKTTIRMDTLLRVLDVLSIRIELRSSLGDVVVMPTPQDAEGKGDHETS
jgi:y4mF family transcriptional regulator